MSGRGLDRHGRSQLRKPHGRRDQVSLLLEVGHLCSIGDDACNLGDGERRMRQVEGGRFADVFEGLGELLIRERTERGRRRRNQRGRRTPGLGMLKNDWLFDWIVTRAVVASVISISAENGARSRVGGSEHPLSTTTTAPAHPRIRSARPPLPRLPITRTASQGNPPMGSLAFVSPERRKVPNLTTRQVRR